MIHELIQTPSIACTFLAELRDEIVQKDRMRFRMNLERLGECMAWEVSKHLDYGQEDGHNPFGQGRGQSHGESTCSSDHNASRSSDASGHDAVL